MERDTQNLKFAALKQLTEFQIWSMTPIFRQIESPLFPYIEGYVNTIECVICVGS